MAKTWSPQLGPVYEMETSPLLSNESHARSFSFYLSVRKMEQKESFLFYKEHGGQMDM